MPKNLSIAVDQLKTGPKSKFIRARTPNGLGVKVEFPRVERVRSKSPIHVTEVVLAKPEHKLKKNLFSSIAEKEMLNKVYS